MPDLFDLPAEQWGAELWFMNNCGIMWRVPFVFKEGPVQISATNEGPVPILITEILYVNAAMAVGEFRKITVNNLLNLPTRIRVNPGCCLTLSAELGW